MTQAQLTDELLGSILQSRRMEDASFSEWIEWFRAEPKMQAFLPEGVCVADPRQGERIVFNESRARRPHDNRPTNGPAPECIVCTAQLTKVLDVAPLSQGFTFINKNLYPIVHPTSNGVGPIGPSVEEDNPFDPGDVCWGANGVSCLGLHFLQWTSSFHEEDWHTMPSQDRSIVMERLASLERKLLTESAEPFPVASCWGGDPDHRGFVQIIKNSGAPVGGSVYHGHQQIAFTNVMPRRTRDDWQFERNRGERFSEYLMRENPPELTLRDYGEAVLFVPYFMRRPYDMILLARDAKPRYLHQLSAGTLEALATGWSDAIRLMRRVLQGLSRNIAYNVVLHAGPGAGVYVEFLPYTQEVGGFEQSGLWICQSSPALAARQMKDLF